MDRHKMLQIGKHLVLPSASDPPSHMALMNLSDNGCRCGFAGASLAEESHQLHGVPAQADQTPPTAGSGSCNDEDFPRRNEQRRRHPPIPQLQAAAELPGRRDAEELQRLRPAGASPRLRV
uniref:Uncharacterized protein n=1 Tax=Aegilops tauschii subsp. strangulata TaxID=200361 RepID=A0A452Z4L7_AEGTS